MELQEPNTISGYRNYAARFTVDRAAQKRHLARNVLITNCFPCLSTDKTTIRTLIRDFLRSVSMPLTLNLAVLTIGVVKECLDMRHYNETLHKLYTIVEITVACLQIVMHTVYIATLYKESIKKPRQFILSQDQSHTATATWLKVYIVFAIVLVLLMASAYFLLNTLHHGWTILSNNACLLIMTAISTIHQRRLVHQSSRIREDELKVALCETFLLLDEMRDNPEVFIRVEQMKSSLAASSLFTVPDYIHQSDNRHGGLLQSQSEASNVENHRNGCPKLAAVVITS